ncbi:hypothetical protein D3C77_624710 [compost metagenome]
METEPFAGVVHTVNKQALALKLFQALLAVVFSGQANDQRVVHRTQYRAAQQERAGIGIDAIQHLIHQIIGQVAGVQPGQTFGRLLSGRGGLTGGERD